MGLISQVRTANAAQAVAKTEASAFEALNYIATQVTYIANNTRLEYEILTELQVCRQCLEKLLEIEKAKQSQ